MRHAVFTIVQDEPEFFPIWYRYYSRYFPPAHIHILHHAIPGGDEEARPGWLRETIHPDTPVIQVRFDETFNHYWLRMQAQRFAAFLLSSYQTITLAEADEIIAVDPRVSKDDDLMRWIDAWACDRGRHTAKCDGYEIIHRYDQEPPCDLEAGTGLLKDRRWWYPCELYSKSLIWQKPPIWSDGFHTAFIVPPGRPPRRVPYAAPPDPGLLLLHLHRFDYGVAASRLSRTAARFTGRPRGGYQNRLQGEEQLKLWWYTNVDVAKMALNPDAIAPLVEMPREIRGII